MPRIRSVKPEFWSDSKLAKLSRDTRLFYIALWSFADDYGRGRALPRELAGFAFPYDSDISPENILDMLRELHEAGRISVYENEGDCFYQVLKWKEHQKPEKPTPSRIPVIEGYDDSTPISRKQFPEASPKPPRSLPEESGSNRGVVISNQYVGSSNQEIVSSLPAQKVNDDNSMTTIPFVSMKELKRMQKHRNAWTVPEITEAARRTLERHQRLPLEDAIAYLWSVLESSRDFLKNGAPDLSHWDSIPATPQKTMEESDMEHWEEIVAGTRHAQCASIGRKASIERDKRHAANGAKA